MCRWHHPLLQLWWFKSATLQIGHLRFLDHNVLAVKLQRATPKGHASSRIAKMIVLYNFCMFESLV